jgi:uncharacterized protein YjbJ (UPF0337 family)
VNPHFNDHKQDEEHAMSGTTDKIKGRVKEAVGVVTGNQRLKDEGRIDQATGKVKKTVERVIDKAKR